MQLQIMQIRSKQHHNPKQDGLKEDFMQGMPADQGNRLEGVGRQQLQLLTGISGSFR